MTTKRHLTLATLAACALVLPATGSIDNPVERPFRSQAVVTWTVNMMDGSAAGYEIGVATHGGLYTNESEAIWDLENFVIVSGAGVATVASGEQLFWEMTPDLPMVVQFTGGTGRFENATGSFSTDSMSEPQITVDLGTRTMTMVIAYTAAGTITY